MSFEIVSVNPSPNEDERAALEVSLGELLAASEPGLSESVWAMAGRAQGRRGGLSAYREQLDAADLWRLSLRWPAGGGEYQGLAGRADAR